MEKRGLLISFILVVTLINFASADAFSIGEVFDSFDSETMLLAVLFLICFSLLYLALGRVFKDKYNQPNKVIASVIGLSLSLIIIYGLYKTGISLEGIFFGIGINESMLGLIAPLILSIGLILLLIKFKLKVLLIFGALFIFLSMTDLAYEKGFLFWFGVILIGLYILIKVFSKKKDPYIGPQPPNNPTPQNNPPQNVQIQNQRIRTIYDLKQKYMAYLFSYYTYRTNPNRKRRMKQAMEIIIKYAEKQGCPPRRFLSKEVGGRNAKAPSELK